MRSGGRARTKPPVRPGEETTRPARARAWRTLEGYPAGTIVRRAISGVLRVTSGCSASNTTPEERIPRFVKSWFGSPFPSSERSQLKPRA